MKPSNGTTSHVGKQLSNLYLNPSNIVGVLVWTKIWPLSVTLTMGLPERMFQMAHLHVMENHCVKLIWNLSTSVKVMVLKNSDSHMHTQMHSHTPNWHCDNYVSLTASSLDNEKSLHTTNETFYHTIASFNNHKKEAFWKHCRKRRKCW